VPDTYKIPVITLLITLFVFGLTAAFSGMFDSGDSLAVEGRFRDRRGDSSQFDGPDGEDGSSEERGRRRIFDPDRPRRFDGSFLANVGQGLLLTAAGVLALALVVKFTLSMFGVI